LTLYSEGAPGQFFTQKFPLDADGRFAGEVPSPGDYKVVIEESLVVQEGRKPTGTGGPVVPRKYRTAAASDLVWAVHDGDDERQLELHE